MSDDLISRKVVLELLFKDGEWCTDISTIYERVENLKTAYEKEKVIEELRNPDNYTIVAGKHFTTVDRSVEIVEKGGIE